MKTKKSKKSSTSAHPNVRVKDLPSKGDPTGGDITVNKAKTADKAYSAMDAYVRG
jgi:hypothetical protein